MELLGSSIRAETSEAEVRIDTKQHTLLIRCISPGCFMVRAHKANATWIAPLYAIEPEPKPFSKGKVRAEDTHIAIESELGRVIIQKDPVRLRFETATGELLSEDDPGLGTIWDDDGVTNYRVLQPGERFFGLGEKTGPLDKAGKQYRNWNTDAYAYNPSTDPLYISCPFFMALSHDRPYGIFLNNHSETTFNFGAANNRFSFIRARDGMLEYYFFTGPAPSDILREYTALTGRMPLPPMWSLGFQQCRYSYYPDEDIIRVARSFREKRIPADVIYFDIHYMQDFKVFTWHKEYFPNPEATIAALRELHFHPVAILDPGVKAEAGYPVYDEGMAMDAFAKYPDGEPYSGAAWPGWCHFPDFTKAAVRRWWAEKVSEMAAIGVEGFWNDMNEPAVWGHHTPGVVQFDMEGNGGSHLRAHNIYGMQMSRATAEGAQLQKSNQRPFILTRATFSGGQRYGALWTGDNHANDEHLMLGARMVAGIGLSGFPFAGNDVGGFTGDASAALYRRWMAQAAFQPLMRAHSMINSKQAEPWSFGEETLEVARNYISLRYALLPHIYSLFYESTLNGMPPLRSLIFDYHREWKIFARTFENQFMLGQHLLVCPAESEAQFVKVYLPEANWYFLFNDTLYRGGEEHIIEIAHDMIPLFVKAGGIIPMQGPIQHTRETGDGILRLHLYTGGQSNYTLYMDDGVTHAYRDGEYALRQIELMVDRVVIGPQLGTYTHPFHTVRVYLHGSETTQVKINGNIQKISASDFEFLPAISNFDPYEAYPQSAKVIANLPNFDLRFEKAAIEVQFSNI